MTNGLPPWRGGFAESPESGVLRRRTDAHPSTPPPAGPSRRRLAPEGLRTRSPPAPPRPRLSRAGPRPRETAGRARALRTLRGGQVSARRRGAERVRLWRQAPRGCTGRTRGGGSRRAARGPRGAGPAEGRGKRRGVTGAGVKRGCAEGRAGRAASGCRRGPRHLLPNPGEDASPCSLGVQRGPRLSPPDGEERPRVFRKMPGKRPVGSCFRSSRLGWEPARVEGAVAMETSRRRRRLLVRRLPS